MANENEEMIWIIIIIINIVIYGLCCFLIIKRKQFSSISIRSPTLLLCNNVSNFVMSLILVLHELIDMSFISIFYYIFRCMMTISIFLRYERILSCFKYNKDKFETNENIEKFADKRYLLQEKFYVKIFIGLFCVLFISLLIIELIGIYCFELFYSAYEAEHADSYKSQMCIWVTLNFLEMMAIMTYIYRIHNKKLKFILKKEIYIELIILFLYSNYVSFTNIIYNYDDFIFTLVSIIVLYLLLILNGYMPIFSSFLYKNIVSYQFTPKLMNNLYLFLTNKDCYKAFYSYLQKKDKDSISLLKLYTHIMKYKLDIVLRLSDEQLYREARDIYNKYFDRVGAINISQDILIKIRNKWDIINNNAFRENRNTLFDDGLKYVFSQLAIKFNDFNKSEEFKELHNDIEIYTFIQCKMCNTGLINKF